MAGKDTSYTHRHWRGTMQELIDALEKQFLPALSHIRADLVTVGAGNSHMQFINGVAIPGTRAQAETGKAILASHHFRLARVGEAQAAAGGLNEVAENKHFNQS